MAANGVSPAPAYPYATPFPYAAIYSYPPSASASAYAPPPSFFPPPASASFPACSYSTAPAVFSFPCSQAPPSESIAPPTPAPPPTGAPSISATPETALLRHPDQVPSAPLASGHSSPTPRLMDAIQTAPNRERRPPQCHASSTSVLHTATPVSMCQDGYLTEGNDAGGESISNEKFVRKNTGSSIHNMVNASLNNRFFMEDDASVQAVADEHVPAKDGVRHRLQRELVNIQARLDQQQARDRTSFDIIQGELAKLTSMASQLADFMGKQSTLATSGSSPVGVTGTVFVAPKVFGEMPAPNSWHGAHAIAPQYENYGYGYPNQIQSSCVQPGSTNLSEQYLDERPQPYGFQNLNRQSILLADGTIHSYYVLPDTYPLDQATPAPVFDVYDVDTKGCTDEFVDVFINTSVQQPHKATDSSESLEELVSEQLPKCFSKAPETEQSSACWNYIKDVLDNAFDKQQQDGEEALVNVQQLRAPPLDVLVLHERRKKWDPGAPVILHSFLSLTACIQYIAPNDMSSALHATCFLLQRAANLSQGNCLCSLYCNSVLNTEYCTERMQWDPGVNMSVYSWLDILTVWSDIVTPLSYTHNPELATWQNQVSSASYIWDPGILLPWYKFIGLFTVRSELLEGQNQSVASSAYSEMVQVLHVKYSARRAPTFALTIMCFYALGLGWTEVKGSALIILVVSCYTCTFAAKQSMLLSHSDSSRTNHPRDFLLMTEMFQNMSDFSNGQLAYMPQSPTINSSEFLRHIFTDLSRWLSSFVNRVKLQWDPGIAFIHQLGVQKNYNAKNLLSSPNYLQILELDIIFITFLPP